MISLSIALFGRIVKFLQVRADDGDLWARDILLELDREIEKAKKPPGL